MAGDQDCLAGLPQRHPFQGNQLWHCVKWRSHTACIVAFREACAQHTSCSSAWVDGHHFPKRVACQHFDQRCLTAGKRDCRIHTVLCSVIHAPTSHQPCSSFGSALPPAALHGWRPPPPHRACPIGSDQGQSCRSPWPGRTSPASPCPAPWPPSPGKQRASGHDNSNPKPSPGKERASGHINSNPKPKPHRNPKP